MNEVKTPKKPLIYYYCIAMLVLMLFNILVMPWLNQLRVHQVDYGTFMTMTDNQEIAEVEIQEQENQILFTSKDGKTIYKTGMIDDPGLVERLRRSGAIFSGEIIEQTSPLLGILLTWVLPILLFIFIKLSLL